MRCGDTGESQPLGTSNMKQQYRHTKPIRGKDPNFEKEELQGYKKTIDDSIDETVQYRLQRNRKLKKIFK